MHPKTAWGDAPDATSVVQRHFIMRDFLVWY